MARIVFFMTFLGLFCLGVSQNHVFAATSPYSVKGVEVDVLDENSAKARSRAFIEAQKKAFETLATRYYAPDELKTLKVPDADTLSGLIQDFKIASEQISAKRYKGVFDFRFKAAAANQHFGRGPINYVDESSTETKKILLIPFYLEEKKSIIFNKSQNPFWGSLLQDIGNTKDIILPEGNIQDLTDIGNRNPSLLSPTIIRRLKARYDVGYIVTAVASVDLDDQTKINIDVKDATSGKPIPLSNFDVEPKLIGKSTLDVAVNVTKPQTTIPATEDENSLGNLSEESSPTVPTAPTATTSAQASVPQSEINPDYFVPLGQRRQLTQEKRRDGIVAQREAMGEKAGLIKNGEPGLRNGEPDAQEATDTESGEANVQVFFNSMSEWVNLQKQLSRLDGITGIRIVTLKTNQGDIVIEYNDWTKLLLSMKGSGLTLNSQSADTYVLKRLSDDF